MIDPQSAELFRIANDIADCRECDLCERRNRTVPGVGLGTATIMLIGEAPGREENQQGKPFVGRCGEYFKRLLRETGGDPRTCFVTNTVKCRPPDNREPTLSEMAVCNGWLEAQLRVICPKIIVCLGKPAARAILGIKQSAKLKDIRGKWFTMENGALVRVLYHPSFLMQHGRKEEDITKGDLQEIWAKAKEITT